MKFSIISVNLLLLVFILTLNGCDFIGDVIEFGFWTGFIFFVVLVLIIGWIVNKFRK